MSMCKKCCLPIFMGSGLASPNIDLEYAMPKYRYNYYDTDELKNKKYVIKEFKDIPDHFKCPYSLDLMRYPYITSQGDSYELEQIHRSVNHSEEMLDKYRVKIDRKVIYNRNLQIAIEQWATVQGATFTAWYENLPISENDPAFDPVLAKEIQKKLNELWKQHKIGRGDQVEIHGRMPVPILKDLIEQQIAILGLTIIEEENINESFFGFKMKYASSNQIYSLYINCLFHAILLSMSSSPDE
jgi:U-box domain